MIHSEGTECSDLLRKIIPFQQWKNVQWMNRRASPREAYSPTQIEHIANVITHGIWVVPSVLAVAELLNRSVNIAQYVSALVYGATLVLIFAISTTFHSVFYCNHHRQLKDVLHRCDRAMIYVFIAGSYFPWLSLQQLPEEGWSSVMRWFVWILAAIGIGYQQAFHERYKSLETIIYLIMGVGPSVPLMTEHDFAGASELKVGGVIYVLGILFFKADGSIPCAHAIWHLFVVAAAAVHYFAILNNLYPEPGIASSQQLS
ncbi:uncharacterized protein CBL_09194 [Carabus blaptoides fortunei]